jgi:hypothetical protein
MRNTEPAARVDLRCGTDRQGHRATGCARAVPNRALMVVAMALALPAGATAANACSGKITLHVSHGKTKWTGKPSGKEGHCVVTLHLKLPVAQYGKAEPFKLTFSGSLRVASFTHGVHLTIAAPTSPISTNPVSGAPTSSAPPGATTTTPTTTVPTCGGAPCTGPPAALDGYWANDLSQPPGDNPTFYFEMIVYHGQVINAHLVNPRNFSCKPTGGEYHVWNQPPSKAFEVGSAGAFVGNFEYAEGGGSTTYGITGQLDAAILTGTIDLTMNDSSCVGDMKGAIHQK